MPKRKKLLKRSRAQSGQTFASHADILRKTLFRLSRVLLDLAVVVYMEDGGFNSFATNMIKLSVSETKWSSLLARTGAFILYILI